MGIGRYKNGKFDLVLSLRHNADADRITQWERSFRRASEILYDATDGQMQFGRLYIANNSAGSDEADAWLLEEEGISSSSVLKLGDSGFHMNLKADEKNKPYIIIHEFGHYALGLYDEYIGPSGSAECTGDADSGACIMEFGWWNGDQIDDDGVLTEGTVNEFCTSVDHDPDGDTYQEDIHGESCWETIKDNYSDITVPAGLPDAPAPAGHDDVEWVALSEAPRFALVLDKSGSMSTNNAIDGVRFGADYWTQFLAQVGDQLSIIAYNQSQDTILPLNLLTPATDLSATLSAIAGMVANGLTNIGGAMSEGDAQIMSPGDQAATQVMILFSDGKHNTGTPPEDVLEQIVDHGIRVYTIGFGPYADQARLQDIAEETGGRFEQIDDPGDSAAAHLDILNYLVEISGEVRDGSGIVTMSPGLLPEPTAGEAAEASEFMMAKFDPKGLTRIAKLPLNFHVKPLGYDHKAYIERGSERATFVVSHKQGTSVNFYLSAPDGRIVDPASDRNVTFVNPADAPYAFYVVDDPEPGYWTMRVVRGHAKGEIPFKVFAFSENKGLSVALKGPVQLYDVGDKIKLQVQAFQGVPLTGINLPTARLIPRDYVKGKKIFSDPVKTVLKERKVLVDPTAKKCKRNDSIGNGIYEGEIKLDKPGSYTLEVRVENTGRAYEASEHAEPRRNEDRKQKKVKVHPFMRTKRFQLHVGPLPQGKDVEGQDGDNNGSGKDTCRDKLCAVLRKLMYEFKC